MDMEALGPWRALLEGELKKPYFAALTEKVDAARASAEVYPPEEETFRAFSLTPPEAVRVVILGQDPYHEPHQANGLAFSVREGVRLPPSLRNIYQELKDDLGVDGPAYGDLTPWARQGSSLTACSNPLVANAKPCCKVVLVSAMVEVRDTAPGILATQ